MNRRLDRRILRNEDRHAIVQERGIERGKGMRIDVEGLSEVLLEAVSTVSRAVTQTGDAQTLRERAQIRQRRRELTVDNRQPDRARHTNAGNQRRRLLERALRERELRFRDRRYVREPPVFLSRGREANRREPRRGLL